MFLFLLGEAVFFFLLIVAYIYFRRSNIPPLHLNETAIFTVSLLASSFTLGRARATRSRPWLLATIALGLIFLAGQGSQYLRLLYQHVTISQSLFGTTFFTLTGLHSLQVAVGLIVLAVVAASGRRKAGSSLVSPVSCLLSPIALYWQFGTVVWLAIFSVVYLWTFL